MAINQLTPANLGEAIQQSGMLGRSVEAPSPQLLANEHREVMRLLASKGVENPSELIDATTQEIAKRGDADGLYEKTDLARAYAFLRDQANQGHTR